MAENQIDHDALVELTSEIAVSHLGNNRVAVEDVAGLIRNIYGALSGLGARPQTEERPKPAVPIRSSVKADHIVCLEDGRKMRALKHHLMAAHGLTPDEYRTRWGLPADYPIVAPSYSEERRAHARKIALGRKRGQRRGRRKTAAK